MSKCMFTLERSVFNTIPILNKDILVVTVYFLFSFSI